MITAAEGPIAVFDYLLSKGCSLAAVDANNDTVLHVASMNDRVKMVRKLLDIKHLDIESRGRLGMTSIMMAARGGHLKMFNFLKSKGSKMEVVDFQKNNLLHVACIGGNEQIVRYLVQNKSFDVNDVGELGKTAVIFAAENGRRNVFKLLANKQGSNLNTVDQRGDSILHAACVGGDLEILVYIHTRDIVDVDLRGYQGKTPIMRAAENGHWEIYRHLSNKECNIKTVDDLGNTILHMACIGGNLKIVKSILTERWNKVDINAKESDGKTAVMLAVEKGYIRIVDFLVKQKCDYKVSDNEGRNLLHAACIGGQLSEVKQVLELKAFNLKTKDKAGFTPLMYAKQKGFTAIVALLESGKY